MLLLNLMGLGRDEGLKISEFKIRNLGTSFFPFFFFVGSLGVSVWKLINEIVKPLK